MNANSRQLFSSASSRLMLMACVCLMMGSLARAEETSKVELRPGMTVHYQVQQEGHLGLLVLYNYLGKVEKVYSDGSAWVKNKKRAQLGTTHTEESLRIVNRARSMLGMLPLSKDLLGVFEMDPEKEYGIPKLSRGRTFVTGEGDVGIAVKCHEGFCRQDAVLYRKKSNGDNSGHTFEPSKLLTLFTDGYARIRLDSDRTVHYVLISSLTQVID